MRVRNETILSTSSLATVSVMVGVTNTLTNMPFDVIKTQMQKDNPIKSEGILKTGMLFVNEHGFKSLYTGWRVRIVQYIIQSTIFVTLLEKFSYN